MIKRNRTGRLSIKISLSRVRNLVLTWARAKLQGAGCRVQGAGCRVQGAGCLGAGVAWRRPGGSVQFRVAFSRLAWRRKDAHPRGDGQDPDISYFRVGSVWGLGF